MIVGERVFHVIGLEAIIIAFTTSHAVMLQRGVAVGTQWESSKSLNQGVVSKVLYVYNFICSPLPVEMIQFVYLSNLFRLGWFNHQLSKSLTVRSHNR